MVALWLCTLSFSSIAIRIRAEPIRKSHDRFPTSSTIPPRARLLVLRVASHRNSHRLLSRPPHVDKPSPLGRVTASQLCPLAYSQCACIWLVPAQSALPASPIRILTVVPRFRAPSATSWQTLSRRLTRSAVSSAHALSSQSSTKGQARSRTRSQA